MMINQTIKQLTDMRLHSMEAEFRRQSELPAMTGLSFEERFGLVVEAEWRNRNNAKIARRMKAAKLRCPAACLEDVDFDEVRKLDKALIARLSDMAWLSESRKGLHKKQFFAIEAEAQRLKDILTFISG